jgi:hypothetical protein
VFSFFRIRVYLAILLFVIHQHNDSLYSSPHSGLELIFRVFFPLQ